MENIQLMIPQSNMHPYIKPSLYIGTSLLNIRLERNVPRQLKDLVKTDNFSISYILTLDKINVSI